MAVIGRYFDFEPPFNTRFFGPMIVRFFHWHVSSIAIDWVFLVVTFVSIAATCILFFDYLRLLGLNRSYQLLGTLFFMSSSMLQHYMVNYVLIDPIFMFFYMACLWTLKKDRNPHLFTMSYSLGLFVKEYMLLIPLFVYFWRREWLKYCLPATTILAILWLGVFDDPLMINSTFSGNGFIRNSNWSILLRPEILIRVFLQAYPFLFPLLILNFILKNPITHNSPFSELWKIWGVSLLKIFYRGEILRYLFVVGFPLVIPLGLLFIQDLNHIEKGACEDENKTNGIAENIMEEASISSPQEETRQREN
jgi:hypothetical protein